MKKIANLANKRVWKVRYMHLHRDFLQPKKTSLCTRLRNAAGIPDFLTCGLTRCLPIRGKFKHYVQETCRNLFIVKFFITFE